MNALIRHPLRICMVSLLALACLGLAGCSLLRIYRMDVRQGNYITTDRVRSLKEGMSKETVLAMMGTPAVTPFFECNQWDYYYYLKPGNGDPIQEQHITVFFSGHHVCRIEEANCCD